MNYLHWFCRKYLCDMMKNFHNKVKTSKEGEEQHFLKETVCRLIKTSYRYSKCSAAICASSWWLYLQEAAISSLAHLSGVDSEHSFDIFGHKREGSIMKLHFPRQGSWVPSLFWWRSHAQPCYFALPQRRPVNGVKRSRQCDNISDKRGRSRCKEDF